MNIGQATAFIHFSSSSFCVSQCIVTTILSNPVLAKLSLGTELASIRAGPSQSSPEQFYSGLLPCVGGRTADFIYPEM